MTFSLGSCEELGVLVGILGLVIGFAWVKKSLCELSPSV